MCIRDSIYRDLRLIIAGKHLIDTEIFSLDQAGNHDGLLKFKYDMVGCKENTDIVVGFAG